MHVPFDTATLQSLYPSYEAYVSAITEAAQQNVRDGFLLSEDAAELISNAQSPIVGTGLARGPLCASVSNFLNHPSAGNLRDHTQVYHFPGGEQLLTRLDQATCLLAEGYTAAEESGPGTREQKFEQAIQPVQRYLHEAGENARPRPAAQVTADLLAYFAHIVIEKMAAQAREG